MRKTPPDILITTPESLYLMISSGAREILTGVEAVIVDEIHAVAPSKRGSHLALTPGAARPPRRASPRSGSGSRPPSGRWSGSASSWSAAGRECEIVDASKPKELDLEIVVPVEDMTEPDANVEKRQDGGDSGDPPRPARAATGPIEPARPTRSIWPAIYPRLLELVQEHTSTIVFVNNRRGAERIAKRLNEMANADDEQELPATEVAGNEEPVSKTPDDEGYVEIARAHHGSLSHEERALVEEMLKSGQLPCLVATSSLELGIDMGAIDLVIQIESPKSVTRGLQRVGRAGHSLGEVSKGRIFPKFRSDLLECAVVARRMRTGRDRGDGHPPRTPSTCWPSTWSRWRRWTSGTSTRSSASSPRPSPSASSRASSSRTCSTCSTGATRPSASPSCARGSSGTAPGARCAAAPAPASSRSPTPARSPTAASTASTCPTAAASASSTRRWSTRRAPARPSCSAPPPGGSRRSPATA